MSRRTPLLGCGLMAALLISSVAGAADYELLGGDYQCGTGDSTLAVFMTWWSSGDLFPDSQFFHRSFETPQPAAEAFCTSHLESLRGRLADQACVLGSVVEESFEGGDFQRSFAFACDAPRRRLVRLSGALYADFLSQEP